MMKYEKGLGLLWVPQQELGRLELPDKGGQEKPKYRNPRIDGGGDYVFHNA
jgi:hypothetical protein